MDERNDVEVFLDPTVPKTFQDAYAVQVEGWLRIFRWSTRRTPKRWPIAEYAPGMWCGYHHTGSQGEEPVEPPKPLGEDGPQMPVDRIVSQVVDAPRAAWSPQEREADIRRREPGALENLEPARDRPPLPPREFRTPTSALPRRTPAAEQTELLPAVREKEPDTGPRQTRIGRRREEKKAARRLPGPGGMFSLLAIVAFPLLTAIR